MLAGIDISKQTLDVCIVREDGISQSLKFQNSVNDIKKLEKLLKGTKRIVLEATGTYHLACAEALHKAGLPVVVVNPADAHYYAKSKARRNKTDKVDAKILAGMASDSHLNLFTPTSDEIKKLRALLQVLEDLKELLSAKKTQLKTPELDAYAIEYYQDEIQRLNKKIKAVEIDIKEFVKSNQKMNESVTNLKTIPGIGDVIATTIVALIPEQILNARQASAYIGLNPSQVESGMMKGVTRISKKGNARLRKLFYIASWSSIIPKGPIRDFYLSLLQRGKCKMSALCAVANKLVRIAHAILRRRTGFNPVHLTNRN
jgi:transposase